MRAIGFMVVIEHMRDHEKGIRHGEEKTNQKGQSFTCIAGGSRTTRISDR